MLTALRNLLNIYFGVHFYDMLQLFPLHQYQNNKIIF